MKLVVTVELDGCSWCFKLGNTKNCLMWNDKSKQPAVLASTSFKHKWTRQRLVNSLTKKISLCLLRLNSYSIHATVCAIERVCAKAIGGLVGSRIDFTSTKPALFVYSSKLASCELSRVATWTLSSQHSEMAHQSRRLSMACCGLRTRGRWFVEWRHAHTAGRDFDASYWSV